MTDDTSDKTEQTLETASPQETDSVAEKQITNKPKKKHTKLKIAAVVIMLLLVLPILVLGWLGFVPGLSDIMGANKPKDLGITYTQADYENYLTKTNVTLKDFATAPENPEKPGKHVVFADPKPFTNLTVSDAELTAAINEIDWLWMPIHNAQVRLSDGVVEVSGNLNTRYANEFIGFIGGVGYSESDVATAVSWAQKFAADAPVYIHATASVQNDTLSFQLNKVQVGRFNVPMDIASTVLSTGTSNAILNTQGLVATSARPINGAMQFSGELPTTIYVKTK